MARLVFTGRCNHGHGRRIFTREDITAEAIRAGHHVQKAVDPSTDFLVASRSDTSKARAAVAMGVSVITYQEYAENLRRGDSVQSVNLGGINLEELALTQTSRRAPPPIEKRAKVVPKPPARVPGRRALDLG